MSAEAIGNRGGSRVARSRGRPRKPVERHRRPSLRRSMFGYLAYPVDGVVKLAENIAKCIDGRAVSESLGADNMEPDEVRKIIRDSVVEGFQAADVHRTWLAELDRIAANAQDLEALKRAISGYVRQAGIERVEDVARPHLYRPVGTAEGDEPQIVQPAYVDKTDGRLILAGRIRTAPVAASAGKAHSQQVEGSTR